MNKTPSSFRFFKVHIKEIDDVIRGIPRGGVFTIMYDELSLGWALAFEILKNLINENCFGVIHNYLLPAQKLESRATFVGLNIRKEAEADNLRIIDIFGSRYNIPPYENYIYQISSPSAETLNPKIMEIYRKQIFPIAGSRPIIRVIYTLDAITTLFEEKPTLKLLNSDLAELARLYHEYNIITILLLNKELVSKHFVGWVLSLSDVVISFKFYEKESKEKMTIIKAMNPEFEPAAYEYTIRRLSPTTSVHALNFKKINSNNGNN
ncbi:hypothetical protein NF865_05945 [Thermococcus aggregans]|uniref:KaiC-like domain-containing protein n=1 Tax=Thermococcus aggregans TaxID=110163 RepID=A0A9E7SME0_THEAG|nr:hypothetical protein [Thermococcus aggregans]USS39908.1 hypothetical protein NF865_05945 [Thermococcus aggregans]